MKESLQKREQGLPDKRYNPTLPKQAEQGRFGDDDQGWPQPSWPGRSRQGTSSARTGQGREVRGAATAATLLRQGPWV